MTHLISFIISSTVLMSSVVVDELLLAVGILVILLLSIFVILLFLRSQKLKRDQHLFKVLMEYTTDSIYFKDKESRFIRINNSTVEKLGFNEESEVIGKSDFDIFTDEHARKAFEDEKNIMTSEEALEGIEEKETWSDGRITWVSSTKLPLYDENNNVMGTFGITRDITQIKESEEKIREAKNRIELLFNLVPSGVFIVDENKVVTAWNKRAEEITGYTKEEVLGKECKLFSGAPCNDFCGLYDETVKKPILGAQCIIITKEGDKIEISKNVDQITDSEGKVIGGIESFEDITEQNRIRTALKNSEARYRTLYENSTIGIYQSDPEGNVQMANPALLKFLGYSSIDELSAIDIATQGYADPTARKRFKELLEKNEEIYGFENAWKKSDGSIVYLRESARIVKQPNRKPLYYEGTIEDITERILAEQKLKELAEELKNINASKDKFFSIIAHDLKSPFTAILGYSEILMNEAEELERVELKEFTTNLNNVAKSTFSLLSNLLEWSRLQTQRIVFSPEDFLVSELVYSIMDLFSQNASSKNIELNVHLDKELKVFADRNMVSTIIRNLVSNAIKFTSSGGQIFISAEQKDGSVKILVKDSGIGISDEDLEKLFKIDSQFTTTGTNQEIGTGLGLLLCKELVEKQGGTIWVESEIDKGSSFFFTLPQPSED